MRALAFALACVCVAAVVPGHLAGVAGNETYAAVSITNAATTELVCSSTQVDRSSIECTNNSAVDVYLVASGAADTTGGYGPYSNDSTLGQAFRRPVRHLYARASEAGTATLRCSCLDGGALHAGLSRPSSSVPTPMLDWDASKTSSYPGTGVTWTSIGYNAQALTVDQGSPTFNAGGWFDLDGNDGFGAGTVVNVPNSSQQRTISVLAWTNAATGTTQHIFSYGANAPTVRFDLVSDTAAKPAVEGFGTSRPSASAVTGQWFYLTARLKNGVNFSDIELFLNGAPVSASGGTGAVATTTGSSTLAVGHNMSGAVFFHTGRIRRVAVWPVPMTDAEIAADFNRVRGGVGI